MSAYMFETGQTWRTRSGETVTISSIRGPYMQIARDGALGYEVAADGRYSAIREHGLDLVERVVPPAPRVEAAPTALGQQVGGDHYKSLKIQPVEFIHANSIPFCEASAIKYLCRWRGKGGVEDLRKARHFIDILIDLEERK